MKPTRDPGADEVFLEVILHETLSGRSACSLRSVLEADADELTRAARAVDAAERSAARTPRAIPWRALGALAALCLIALYFGSSFFTALWSRTRPLADRPAASAPTGSVWVSSSADCDDGAAAEAADVAADAAADRRLADGFRRYLDRFHAVMPTRPVDLRDPSVRANTAVGALPVLRQLDEFLRGPAAGSTYGALLREFRIYALVLGDVATERRVRELAERDPVDAGLQLATAAMICASDRDEREAALRRLAHLLATPSPAAVSAVRCLCIAAGLDEAEARSLADAAADEPLARQLEETAAWAAKDPRQRLGEPLALAGVLRDGREFSTTDWHGKLVIVHFWASWSVHCDHAIGEVLRARGRYSERDVEIVGVCCDRDPTALQTFLTEHPEISWPQLFDAAAPGWHALASALGVSFVPRVFLIDREGVLQSVDAQYDLAGEIERVLAR